MSPFGPFRNVDKDLVEANVRAYFTARDQGAGHHQALQTMVETRYFAPWDENKKAYLLEELVARLPSSSGSGSLRLVVFEIYELESHKEPPLSLFSHFNTSLKKYQASYPMVVLDEAD